MYLRNAFVLNQKELKDIGITYHNVCEIYKQLEAKDKESNNRFEEITE